ncbi:hypothetical protein D3C79_659720 [compost metagenome]
MAALAGGDDVIGAVAVQLAPFARQLDCPFASFGAAVEQVGLIAAGAFAQAIDQVQQATVMKTRPRIDQRLRLAAQGFDQHTGAVAEAVDCTALGEIQICVTFAVPQP